MVKRITKRLTAFLLALVFVSALVPVMPAMAAESGTCGDNLTWTLDDDGKLTIRGTGDMTNWDFTPNMHAPWYDSRESIKTAVIESGVTSIGEDAFCNCSSLTGITIPDSVTSIGDYAFNSCKSLTSITIPDSVTSIGDYAFSWCESLTSIIIPDSVTSIGDYAFNSCKSLTSITIPDSVTSIGYWAFNSCESLTSINVNEKNQSYCSIDGNLFNKDKSILIQYAIGKTENEYIIPASITSIGDAAFSDCESLTSITIPNSVTSIGDHAFDSCESLTSITIPDSVTSIGYWAFSLCESLTSITIPDSVTSIGDYAFRWCESLTDVYYSGSELEWNEIEIGEIGESNESLINATIHYNSEPPMDGNGTSGSKEPSDWAKSDIDNAILLELIPDELQSDYQTAITRVDFCKLALRLYTKVLGAEGVVSVSNKFNDLSGLSSDESFAVGAAAQLGIVSGYDDGSFRPYNQISREEAAVMLSRTARLLGKSNTDKSPVIFSDFDEISDWALEDVNFISAIGVMSGEKSGEYTLAFKPSDNYTREQAMITFLRLYNVLIECKQISDKPIVKYVTTEGTGLASANIITGLTSVDIKNRANVFDSYNYTETFMSDKYESDYWVKKGIEYWSDNALLIKDLVNSDYDTKENIKATLENIISQITNESTNTDGISGVIGEATNQSAADVRENVSTILDLISKGVSEYTDASLTEGEISFAAEAFKGISKGYEWSKFTDKQLEYIFTDYVESISYIDAIEQALKDTKQDTQIMNEALSELKTLYTDWWIEAIRGKVVDLTVKEIEELSLDTIKSYFGAGDGLSVTKLCIKLANEFSGVNTFADGTRKLNATLCYSNSLVTAYKYYAERIQSGNYNAKDVSQCEKLFDLCKQSKILEYNTMIKMLEISKSSSKGLSIVYIDGIPTTKNLKSYLTECVNVIEALSYNIQ